MAALTPAADSHWVCATEPVVSYRAGILIVGSLYWEDTRARRRWRDSRLDMPGARRIHVPIRYGRRSQSRNNTFTMVFARSCSGPEKLGVGLVVPALVGVSAPQHLLDEAEHLWAAERNLDTLGGITAAWGRVCILTAPGSVPPRMTDAWQMAVRAAGPAYRDVPAARGEAPVLDPVSGRARFDWPADVETGQPLQDFDVLLMTATEPTLTDGNYASSEEIARAWMLDSNGNDSYFHSNKQVGITTFEDDAILTLLKTRA